MEEVRKGGEGGRELEVVEDGGNTGGRKRRRQDSYMEYDKRLQKEKVKRWMRAGIDKGWDGVATCYEG